MLRLTIFPYLSCKRIIMCNRKSCKNVHLNFTVSSGNMDFAQILLGVVEAGSNGSITFDIFGDIGSGKTVKSAVPFMATVRE